MKLFARIEGHNVCFEVSEKECIEMVKRDYETRLREAEDREAVHPRTAQEIINDVYKDEYNNDRKHASHKAMYVAPKKDPNEEDLETDGVELLEDEKVIRDFRRMETEESTAALERMMKELLTKKEADVLIAVFLEDISLKEYVAREGRLYNSCQKVFKRAKNKLLKNLSEKRPF